MDLPNSIYRNNNKIKEWAISTLKFWSTIQHKDGSFDEWYPNEHSYVATAFPTYALSELFKILAADLSTKEKDHALDTFNRAGKWLMKHEDPLVPNHEVGAVIALYNLYEITKDTKFKKSCEKLVTQVIKNQSSEGWFSEYNGADIGYLTLGIDYLAKYYKKSGNQTVLKSLENATDFLSYFIHPNGTLGGEYGSRNTEFFIPHGLEILSTNIPLAGAITDKYLRELRAGNAFHPGVLDDRFIAYNLYTFLQAYAEREKREKDMEVTKLPCERKPFKRFFKGATLFVIKTNEYYAVVGLNKGGVIKIYQYPSSKLIFSDCGAYGKIAPSINFSNQVLSKRYSIKTDKNYEKIRVGGKFCEVKYHRPTPFITVLFRSGLLISGMSTKFNNFLKRKLREKLILKYNTVPINFTRTFHFKEDHITVEDYINIAEKLDITELRFNDKFALTYVPSSRYYLTQDAEVPSNNLQWDELIKKINLEGKIELKRKIFPRTGKISIEVIN